MSTSTADDKQDDPSLLVAATDAADTSPSPLAASVAAVAAGHEDVNDDDVARGTEDDQDEDNDDKDNQDNDDGESTTTASESTHSSTAIENAPHPKDAHELYAQAMQHKQEGNALFQSGDLVKASRSYRKGTSLLKHWSTNTAGASNTETTATATATATASDVPPIEEQIKVLLLTLQTNLSMVCYQQNKFQQSRDIASKALTLDSQNVKALYRRAMAHVRLGNVNDAKKDLKLACTIDPSNRAVKKELYLLVKEMEKEKQSQRSKLAKAFSSKGGQGGGSFLYGDKEEEERKKELEKQKKEQEEQKAREKRKLEWEEECVKRLSRGEEAITFQEYEKYVQEKEKKDKEDLQRKEKEQREKARLEKKKLQKENSSNVSSTRDEEDSSDDEVLTEKEMQMLRGYKKTKDGRTTSYFTREQSEDEKKLLGNIAPKRLDVPSVPQRLDSMQSVSSSKSASLWNNAGTWEEKDTSEWCSSSLKGFLKDAAVEVDLYSGKVTEVNNLTGEASVAFVSGKKRYVFDYSANIKYEIMDEGGEVVAKGTLKLPDITSASITELEVEVMPWKKAPRVEVELIAGKCREALIANVRQQVLAFVNAFNEQY
mmetsp:Transcript_9471/g.17823  ORF Transcript_9471/g.17823 Transcript_9471/m.17823 type:complete len:600 (+) Transcript_9471:107-1906(+)